MPEETININYAHAVTPDVEKMIDDMFEYHPWTPDKTSKGVQVRKVLSDAVKVIVHNVPASADRSAAIRKIREARMDCNSAITFDGRY